MSRLTGLIAAPFTPMHPDGSLNLELIPQYAAFLARNGVTGVYICGSTGESPSLTQQEKKSLMESWAVYSPSNLQVLANIGDTTIGHAAELMRYAHRLGLAGVGAVGPYYFKPASVELLVDYCAKIAAVEPEMPFYYYHIPELTGVHFPMHEFLEMAAVQIPNLAGMKFSHNNLMEFNQCVRAADGVFDLYWGRDEVLLSALVLGGIGGVGSTYNYAAPLYHQIIAAFEDGDMKSARSLQEKAIDMVSLLGKYGGLGTGKAFMKLVGIDCGNFRTPVRNVGNRELDQLHADLDKIGFWEFASK